MAIKSVTVLLPFHEVVAVEVSRLFEEYENSEHWREASRLIASHLRVLAACPMPVAAAHAIAREFMEDVVRLHDGSMAYGGWTDEGSVRKVALDSLGNLAQR